MRYCSYMRKYIALFGLLFALLLSAMPAQAVQPDPGPSDIITKPPQGIYVVYRWRGCVVDDQGCLERKVEDDAYQRRMTMRVAIRVEYYCSSNNPPSGCYPNRARAYYHMRCTYLYSPRADHGYPCSYDVDLKLWRIPNSGGANAIVDPIIVSSTGADGKASHYGRWRTDIPRNPQDDYWQTEAFFDANEMGIAGWHPVDDGYPDCENLAFCYQLFSRLWTW